MSGGGLIQFVANGASDIYIHGNPEVSFFGPNPPFLTIKSDDVTTPYTNIKQQVQQQNTFSDELEKMWNYRLNRRLKSAMLARNVFLFHSTQ
jgi:hypothetical protein